MYEKLVVVTRKTRLQELVERFNTAGQARFYIEHAGGDFGEYLREDDVYQRSLDSLRRSVEVGLSVQWMDRQYLPTYLFTDKDLVVTVGQDGLVANTAKYIAAQPLIAVNPDPERFDGVLLPFLVEETRDALAAVLAGRHHVRKITLAQAALTDGQRLLAFNDLYIGVRSHTSARYRIRHEGRAEPQSSSGVLVSTGAGSTGWLSSVFNMALSVSRFAGAQGGAPMRLGWEDRRLFFVVREPFVSRHSQADLVAGVVGENQPLELESLMPSGGVIFSDGVEQDFIAFNSGATVKIGAAEHCAHLVVPRAFAQSAS